MLAKQRDRIPGFTAKIFFFLKDQRRTILLLLLDFLMLHALIPCEKYKAASSFEEVYGIVILGNGLPDFPSFPLSLAPLTNGLLIQFNVHNLCKT